MSELMCAGHSPTLLMGFTTSIVNLRKHDYSYDMRPDNSIDYLEFASTDLPATKAFFTTVFSWVFQDYGPDYAAFEDGKMTGGFFATDKVSTAAEGAPLVVFYHSDLEGAKADVEKAGCVIKREIFSFPGGRRFHFTEPGGNEFAVWSE